MRHSSHDVVLRLPFAYAHRHPIEQWHDGPGPHYDGAELPRPGHGGHLVRGADSQCSWLECGEPVRGQPGQQGLECGP